MLKIFKCELEKKIAYEKLFVKYSFFQLEKLTNIKIRKHAKSLQEI